MRGCRCLLTLAPVRARIVFALFVLLIGLALPGRAEAAYPSDTPPVVPVQRNVVYSTVERVSLTLDIFYPPQWSTMRPAVILVHGGAWVGGDKSNMAELASHLAANGFVAIPINYRLASSTPWPSEFTDVQNAIRFIRGRAAQAGIDPNRIGILGDSAGGNLAALAAMNRSGSWTTDARVRSVVSFSGIYDLTTVGSQLQPQDAWVASSVESYVGCPVTSSSKKCRTAYTSASPVYQIDRSDPPVLMFDSRDEFIPTEQADAMAAALTAAGVPVTRTIFEGAEHGSALFSVGWDETLAFLRRTV
jgi:acetyl esterase